MRVRWNSMGGNILRETEVMRKIELSQIKKQIEVLTTFLPDLILKLPKQEFDQVHHFVGVLLFADVSGFTPLCEKYNKTGKGGIYRLTATLNAYIGAIVEVIYSCGGDVLKFSGDAFLALWKSGPDERLYRVIHEVIVCALFIQQTLGHFETEVNVLLKVKLAISCGNMTFSVIGDDENKHYIILGPAITDVKAAEHASVSGDVVVAPTAWGHVAEESYDVTYTDSKNVKVWRCLYKPNERSKKEEYDEKFILIQQLIAKHIHHRETLNVNKMAHDNVVDSRITERFVRSLPQRETLKIATQRWYTKDMNPFIIKPVQEQVEEKQPLEYLTEMREITIMFINIVPTTYDVVKLVVMLNNAYQVVCKIVRKLLGVVNKVSLFDKDAMLLVLFGLRGIKHEIESQNSLKSAYQIRKEVSKLEGVESVSVGVTNGLVYCGVVGHPLRREYTVIGGSVNKAARLMCAFVHKVTCDYKTYKNSKLSSYYFQMQPAVKLKGIEDAGHVFEYNEDFESILHCEKSDLPLIGRDGELRYINNVIFHPIQIGYQGICYYGKQKVGQTRLLHSAYMKYYSAGFPVGAVQLCGGSVRPYFCVSHLYKQLYDSKAKINSGEENAIKNLPADLWNYNDILQQSKSQIHLPKQQKILNIFKSICSSTRKDVTILFIDNIQYIDNASMKVITSMLGESYIRLFATGHFEEDHWKTRWELFKSNCIKLEELSPMRPDEIPSLVCQLLRIRGVPKKLVSLLMRTCEGCPGWIQTCLLRLVNNGCLEIKFMNVDDIENDKYIFPPPELLSEKYADKERETHYTQKTLLSVAELLDKFKSQAEELTLAAISLDLFDSFTPYQQLVIKTGAVLGDIFSRSLLIVILKYPNEQVFANTIMNLYKEEVFDCGTKYISSGGQLANTLNCYCYIQEEDFSQDMRKSKDLPTYALCKLMHFKNKSLRSVAYELLPANQRKELHLRITNVLENQNNMCPNCLRDDSVAIIKMKTFKQVMQFCGNKNLSAEESLYSDTDSNNYNEVNIKDVIRESIQAPDDHEETRKGNSYDIYESNKFRRKVWDPTTCFCLEIMTKVYVDLIFHSDKAGQLGKKIFYLMQYGAILMTMHEFKDAIPVLTEASELCMTDAKCKNSFITEEFRRVHVGRIHFLLSEVNFRLGDIGTAKVHIAISLRQYNVPIISLRYRIPHLLLKRPAMFTKVRNPKFSTNRGVRSLMHSDFGHCLNLLSNICAAEGRWSMAKMAAKRSLCLLTIGNPNISILCDSYSTAIELYNFCGDLHTCEILDRSVSRNILKSFTGNLIVELYSICKLITVVFLSRITHGHLSKAIRIGYRAMELNMTIQASYVQLEVIPILASALLLANRIENAVYVIRVLYNIERDFEDFALLDYYAFCLELNLETSFLLEPIEVCERFAEKHFERKVDRECLTDSENKITLLLHVYFLRNGRWSDALKWKTLMRIDKSANTSIFAIFNLMKFTESLLITFVWNKASRKAFLDLEEKRLLAYMRQCQKAAHRWRVCMPRYLHYLAYYNRIISKPKSSRILLKKALLIAREQENILEVCWINQSKSTWSGGLNFGNDAKQIDWKLAHTYSGEQWSQILYALPCNVCI